VFKHNNAKQFHSQIKRLFFNNGQKCVNEFVREFKRIVVRESFKITF